MPNEYIVPRLIDARILKAFESILSESTPKSMTFSLVGDLKVDLDRAKEVLGKANGFLISDAYVQYPNYSVRISRQSNQSAGAALLDHVSIRSGHEVGGQQADSQPGALDNEEKFQVTKVVFDTFLITGANRQVSSSGEETKAKIENLHLSILDRLQAAATDQLIANQKHAQQMDELLAKRREELNADHEKQLKELELQRAELERLRAELDDRDNTHVRRELRRSINEHIQQNLRNFSFRYLSSKGISTLHALYVFLILFFGLLSSYFAVRLSSIPFDIGSTLNPNLLILGIKQTASIVALVFVVTMYIRFLNQNVKRAADFEFMIRNFQLDIERASWAVETALEWRRHEGGQMPDALLTGVTKDLFKRHDRTDEPETSAADSLASALLGSAARAQVDLPFGKLEYDGKGIKKLEKDKSTQ